MKKETRARESETQRLAHELELHQVELDLQNEELRTSRLETEAALAPMATMPRTVAHRILVIDDNVDGATSMQDALVLLGHDVRVAYTGTEGLAVAHEFHPEVVICDIGLPDLDGYGVAATIRGDAELKGCLLIALSGYAQPADVARAHAAGFDRHLAKPASVKKIADAVAQVHSHA